MRRILLVEDEDMLRTVYTRILTTEPYQLDTAANGQEALDLCAANRYDLILLDLMMPVVDGVGFLERYDANDAQAAKVILLSNLSSGNELARAISLGAHKNVLKADLSPRQLLAMVRYEISA